MNLLITPNFVQVSENEFWTLLQDVNWLREAYCGGEIMVAVGTKRRVAIHDEKDKFYVNRDYFKPA